MTAILDAPAVDQAEVPDHEVVIVGAGFAGIGAGIKLKDAGIDDFVILEKAADIGGTWRDNTYPGVAVDVTSYTYSFSFEPNPNWSRAFAPGGEVKAYADHCVDKYALRPHLRLRTTVARAEFDEASHLWRLSLEGRPPMTTRFVISAGGGLTQPKLPDIEGVDTFAGKTMHTARWDHGYDVRGKRVAVIGTGASAVQVVPAIAPDVKQLTVFQRTPIWCAPKPDVMIPRELRALFRFLPPAQLSLRAVTSAFTETMFTLGLVHNKQLPGLVKAVETLCLAHLRRSVPDPELRAKLTPHYGFGCKRPSFSNDYWRTFTRANVELVTEPIARITESGIETNDGQRRDLDTLILATGFKVFELGNTPPMPFVGLGGVELGAHWDKHRYTSYQGASMPQFPNSFTILGPYAATGGSWFQMVENQTRHALRCITEARRRKATYVAVRPEAHDRFMAYVRRREPNTVFFNNDCTTANSYYFDRHGDAPLLRPSSSLEAWWDSRTFSLDDYEFRAIEQDQPVLRTQSASQGLLRAARELVLR